MTNLERVKSLPGLRHYRHRKYRRRFEREGTHNLFYGTYDSFAAALSDAPTNRRVGYDNEGAAEMYDDHLDRIAPDHYPALLFLSRGWGTYRRVLDFGGHRGALFYAGRRLFGDGPEWFIFDLPAVVEAGQRMATERGIPGIFFESELSRIPEVDLVVASGSLQYLEDDADEWIERIGGHPNYVMINAMPVHPTLEFVTLNNMGTAYCPYKVRRQGVFLDRLRARGFDVIEEWHHRGKVCFVPFHVPQGEVTYWGGLFERR